MFTFRENVTALAVERMDEFLGKERQDLVLVGVHIRRTDYAGIMKTMHKGQPPDETFFRAAFDYFREKYGRDRVRFLVASDAMGWAKLKLRKEEGVVLIGNL